MIKKENTKLFHKVSVKSKFLMMILGIAVLSIAVVAFQGLYYGKNSLTKSMHDHLTSIQSARTQQIESYFKEKQNLMKTFSSQKSIVDAMGEFTAGFNLLETYNVVIDKNSTEQLNNFYKNSFVPKLNQNSIEAYSFASVLPKENVVKYLQYHYIIENPSESGKKDLMESAADKSYYSEVHQKFHTTMRDIVKNQGFRDLFLIDIKTLHVVYAVHKGVDFSTNLKEGPYAQSSLARVVKKVISNPDKGVVRVADFKNYKPSHNKPQSFFAVPIYEKNTLIGILATQISIDSINDITTGHQNWEHEGLGQSGEVYLVGRDYKMRSDARKIIQNPKDYMKDLNKTDLNPDSKKMIGSIGSTVINQEVRTESVKLATQGEEGMVITRNYLGKKVLSSYAPLHLDGLDWSIIAEKEISEAEQPIRDFQNALLISGTILATLITFYAIWLAYNFLAPVNSMISGLKGIINRETTSKINLNRNDEFGELSNNIDKMIDTINLQHEEIANKEKRNNELLLNILPESIAKRVKSGEDNIAEIVPNVAVLFSTLQGFDMLSNNMTAKESIELLNELIDGFDEHAQNMGIEKITTIGDSYMAASGLNSPRLDYARRITDYAEKMFQVVNAFNMRHNTDITLSVGIDCGDVMAGIVGKHKFVYDIWGEIVNDANRISHEALDGTLRVSTAVYEQLTNQEKYSACEGGSEPTFAMRPISKED